MSQANLNFDDIRPFNDAEVGPAIAELLNDHEFLAAIIAYRFGIRGFIGQLLEPLVRWSLRRKLAKLQTVADVQLMVGKYLQTSLQRTSAGLTCSGLEKLDKKLSYLFICNHRDIAMDPSVVNWCLHQHGFSTCRIAIGDNLLKKACVTTLMRLNKSFIVRRSAKAPREMLKAFNQLSAYIAHSLAEGENIWIAQKEGRAKDGNDATDPAILKMFYMAGKSQQLEFSEYMQQLRIVPVSISYELDPCDVAKARELAQRATEGIYQKSEFEDIESIIQGIVGQKGRIHVHFGDSPAGYETPEQLAQLIDQQIYSGYQLFELHRAAAGEPVQTEVADRWQAKLGQQPEALRPFITQIYANPVFNARRQVK